jgi:GT2 family glycosyltransferase
MTPWSLFCSMTGLSLVFRDVEFFNAEALGGWRRDTVRLVDIVVGCFLMIRTSLWRQLGGFDTRYFMYGEEADLCLRAAGLGYTPMITPNAEIMHLVGASTSVRADKIILLWKAKATLIRDHWPKPLVPVGLAELWLHCAIRKVGSVAYGLSTGRRDRFSAWEKVWAARRDWLSGY